MASATISHTDLLIIGAGPAGMMAAAWASQYEISTRIIDKNHARIAKGQADGLQSRTLEIFDSFGVADHVWKRGFHDIEICTWVCKEISRIWALDSNMSNRLLTTRGTSKGLKGYCPKRLALAGSPKFASIKV